MIGDIILRGEQYPRDVVLTGEKGGRRQPRGGGGIFVPALALRGAASETQYSRPTAASGAGSNSALHRTPESPPTGSSK